MEGVFSAQNQLPVTAQGLCLPPAHLSTLSAQRGAAIWAAMQKEGDDGTMRLSFIIFEPPGSSVLVPTPSACGGDESLRATMGMGCRMRSLPMGSEWGGGVNELLLSQVPLLGHDEPSPNWCYLGMGSGGRGLIEASTLEIHRNRGC